MPYQPGTLGQLIADLMRKQNYSNRALANAAGVSDTAIRNLLKFGLDKRAKEPDAQTLQKVADALEVEPLRLFQLAGYIPPDDRFFSPRAEYLAKVFDKLSSEQQDAILRIVETMVGSEDAHVLQQMRDDSSNPLAGFDLSFPAVIRMLANQLIAMYDMTEPADLRLIQPDAQILQYVWGKLPQSTQERVKALIRHKLSLDYDPTMVDPEWRG